MSITLDDLRKQAEQAKEEGWLFEPDYPKWMLKIVKAVSKKIENPDKALLQAIAKGTTYSVTHSTWAMCDDYADNTLKLLQERFPDLKITQDAGCDLPGEGRYFHFDFSNKSK